jgi:transcriptional regulator
MLLGRFVFCLVSIAFAPSLVMPAKSLAADKKVDCGKILTEIESGKSAQEVAKMMGISTSSVYRCEKKATTSIPSATSSRIAIPTPSVRPY